MIRAIAECGGAIGVNFSAGFISPDIHSHTSRIDDMVRHMKHMYQVGGIECMALGGDLDGIRGDLEIDSVDKVPLLIDRLHKEGFTSSELDQADLRQYVSCHPRHHEIRRQHKSGCETIAAAFLLGNPVF